jgi:hypothetical protein
MKEDEEEMELFMEFRLLKLDLFPSFTVMLYHDMNLEHTLNNF